MKTDIRVEQSLAGPRTLMINVNDMNSKIENEHDVETYHVLQNDSIIQETEKGYKQTDTCITTSSIDKVRKTAAGRVIWNIGCRSDRGGNGYFKGY